MSYETALDQLKILQRKVWSELHALKGASVTQATIDQIERCFREIIEDVKDLSYQIQDERLARKMQSFEDQMNALSQPIEIQTLADAIDRSLRIIEMFSEVSLAPTREGGLLAPFDTEKDSAEQLQGSEKKVFIVLGHDEIALSKTENLLRKLALEPIVLRDRANEGHTIIEKFERNSDVGFAIVLMTSDDVGGLSKDSVKPRARQNVILELGYFIAKLSRKRVAILKSDGVEAPSDIFGLVYTSLDKAGAWQWTIARELKNAGYTIDLNHVLQ
ncbi:TIR domain-containing protein [Falsihalocynthiibacter sp. BN13B15]|uniref:TIR domain-containing protein n=1 Tax=Falsihalocynthiibacter sp. BN13B15 TaxID=3240871 RepID=UPI00350EA2E3